MSSIQSHKDLEVWQLSMQMAEDCYKFTRDFPRTESFGMTAQIRRASVSIAANIAEGYGRGGTKSFVQFLRIAQGSQKERETHLMLCARVELLPQDVAASLLDTVERIGRMLRNLIRSLEAKQIT